MKDLIVKMIKAMFEAMLKVAVEALKNLDWKKVIYNSYQSYKPELEKKVDDSESKVDDAVIKALDVLMEKFFKPEEKAENAS